MVLLAAGALWADPLDLRDLDKSVFDRLKAKASDSVNITLDGGVLKMAAGFLSSTNDADAAKVRKLVGGLKSVNVRSFEFKNKGDYSQADVAMIRSQIKGSDWTRIVDTHSKEDGATAEIYILPGKDKPMGLFILATEPTQLTVVHILGSIDLNDLGSLEDLGVPNVMKDRGDK
jgi:hypothetical protein